MTDTLKFDSLLIKTVFFFTVCCLLVACNSQLKPSIPEETHNTDSEPQSTHEQKQNQNESHDNSASSPETYTFEEYKPDNSEHQNNPKGESPYQQAFDYTDEQSAATEIANDDENNFSQGALTDEEKAALLDRQLDAKFSEFDDMLLTEQEALRQQENEENTVAGGSSSTSDGNAGFSDSDINLEGFGDENPATIAKAGSEDPPPPPDKPTGTARQVGSPGNKASVVPDDIPGGEDDDIVARQLREAAMKETDPVLREKLWDEYRKYKKGQ